MVQNPTMSDRKENAGLEPKAPSTPSRKRKRGISSPSPSSTVSASKSIRNFNEVASAPSPLSYSSTHVNAECEAPPFEVQENLAEKVVTPDALGSSSPGASTA